MGTTKKMVPFHLGQVLDFPAGSNAWVITGGTTFDSTRD